MEKLCVGASVDPRVVSLNKPLLSNIRAVAEAKGNYCRYSGTFICLDPKVHILSVRRWHVVVCLTSCIGSMLAYPLTWHLHLFDKI